MNLFPKFELALPLAEFLARFGTATDKPRWENALAATQLTDAQKKTVGTFRRAVNVMVVGGAWCDDCVSQCPIFERIAELAPMVKVRYLDRDEHPDAQKELQINGGDRVPVVVFFSEDGHEILRYGERTLAKYRSLVEQLGGESCATGLVKGSDPLQQQIAQDWLNEFERVQCILRLSPRLRQKYGD